MNLTPTQLLQKHSREETYPQCLLGFTAPEMHRLEMWEWTCPDVHMGRKLAYWAEMLLFWIEQWQQNVLFAAPPRISNGILSKSRFTEILPSHLNVWGKLWHPYTAPAVVLFFACKVLVASNCMYGILQIPQLEKQVPFNAGKKLHVVKRLNEKHYFKPPGSHRRCAPSPRCLCLPKVVTCFCSLIISTWMAMRQSL